MGSAPKHQPDLAGASRRDRLGKVRPVGPAAQRGAARRAVRRLAADGRAGPARPAGSGAGRASRGLGQLRRGPGTAEAIRQFGLLIPGLGADRDLRGHLRRAGGPRPRPRLRRCSGAAAQPPPEGGHRRPRTPRRPVRPVHRQPGGGRLLRPVRAHRPPRGGQSPPGREAPAGGRRRRAARPRPRRVPVAQRVRPGRGGQLRRAATGWPTTS